jgi:transcriptional regulator with XRE-family HTH domain
MNCSVYRKKLGISQRELGILTGATIGAVLSWEKGKFRPKGEKKAALVALRKLKKREVKKLLAEKAEESKKGKAEKKPARKNLSRKKVAPKEKAVAKRQKAPPRRAKKG